MPTQPTLPARLNALTTEALFLTKTPPPLAARALAIVHTAMYDAWTAYQPNALSTTTGSLLRRPVGEHSPASRAEAFSHAAYRTLTDLFWQKLPPTHKGMFREMMCELGFDPDNRSLDPSKPAGLGNLAARLVLDRRHGDGSNQRQTLNDGAYSDYTRFQLVNADGELNDVGKWLPTRQKDGSLQPYLAPHWELVEPFALESAGQFRPDPPILPTDKKAFREQAERVIEVSNCLDDEQKMQAEFWAGLHDDLNQDTADPAVSVTPPAQLCGLARWVSGRRSHKNGDDIKLFFMLSNALLDSGIACWEAKRFYEYGRPVSVIHELFCDEQIDAWAGTCEGSGCLDGQDWKPYIGTPPFPEHVSGHSTFSSATAEILRRFTCSEKFGFAKTFAACSSKIEPDCTPSRPVSIRLETFGELAEQAGLSRIYGGIHFENANWQGFYLGEKVANAVWEKAEKLFNE